MNRQVAGAIALTIAVALGWLLLGHQPAAQGQKPETTAGGKAPQWEYKIYRAIDADFVSGNASTEFNKLAGEGWEFVETLVSRVTPTQNAFANSSLAGQTCMLFKRLK